MSRIERFNPKDLLVRDGVMSVIASTGSGKTVFIIDCLAQIHNSFDHVILISKTARLQKCYDFIDRSMIYDTFDEKFLGELWETQKKKKLEGLPLERILIIFDDVLNDKEVRRSTIFDDYFTGGRHINISVWLLSHNFTTLKPLQRNNTCWFVSFDLDSHKERDNLCSQYLSTSSQKEGMDLFTEIVREAKFQCIVIEGHKNGCSIEEKVKKYIANPNPKPFKIKNTIGKLQQNTHFINSRPRIER